MREAFATFSGAYLTVVERPRQSMNTPMQLASRGPAAWRTFAMS